MPAHAPAGTADETGKSSEQTEDDGRVPRVVADVRLGESLDRDRFAEHPLGHATAAFSAFGTFLLRQFMLSIPASLDEAAEIDGANKWQARVNRSWRFYFKIVDGAYLIGDITPHPK